MKISRIDKSIHGAILLSQLSPRPTSIGTLQASRLHNGCSCSISKNFLSLYLYSRATRSFRASISLAPSRLFSTVTRTTYSKRIDPNFFTAHFPSNGSQDQSIASLIDSEEPEEPTQKKQPKIVQSKHELIGFVGRHDGTPVEEYLETLRDPYMRKYAPSNGPDLIVSDRPEDIRLQSIKDQTRGARPPYDRVNNLREAIYESLRNPARMDLDKVWSSYHQLPEPRLAHISAVLRHALLAALGKADRNAKSMLRYFTVVADVKNSGFSLTRAEWNRGLSFTTRYVATTTEVEVEAALRLWRQMETEAGIKGNEVTFNILFDAASKAGKFKLAEMIYEEMNNRALPFNRYHHVSLIHFFGLRQDADGIRAAYTEMIEAGEIIDSVTLNCVIAGFIRAGQEDSALYVYEKMKASNEDLKTMPSRDQNLQRRITRILMMFAKMGKEYPDMRGNFQKTAILCPDLHTYRILINHFGVTLGDLAKVAQFLDEMQLFKVPVHGAIFLALFKGFAIHAGPGSDWTAQRLDSIWKAFLKMLDVGAEGLYISTWLAMAVLKAFSRYSSQEELLNIFECLRSRWDLDEANTHFMLSYLNKLLSQDVGRGRTRDVATNY
ncbi:hypothetical protein F5X96DRAFT_616171 [Biscogniauxia mediterranea]|nr:hypothetical protein F5X96DRAFT_616171 [Biscogniauxia mediterranea]